MNLYVVSRENRTLWWTVTNVAGTDKRRVDMIFGIGYVDNIDKAQRTLKDILLKHDAVSKPPGPVENCLQHVESSVYFSFRPWVKSDDYMDVYWDITRKVKERFGVEDISIPFSQRDVHINQVGTSQQ